MIHLALKNRTTEPFKWVLFGNGGSLPQGVEYSKSKCGISIAVWATLEDQSQKEEYERITNTPENIIAWMSKHFQIKDIDSLRTVGYVVEGMGETNSFVSFHPEHKEEQYGSESKIRLDDEEYELNQFIQENQCQCGVVDVVRSGEALNSIMSPHFIGNLPNAKELSIVVAPGEMIRVLLWFKDFKPTMGHYMDPPNIIDFSKPH